MTTFTHTHTIFGENLFANWVSHAIMRFKLIPHGLTKFSSVRAQVSSRLHGPSLRKIEYYMKTAKSDANIVRNNIATRKS